MIILCNGGLWRDADVDVDDLNDMICYVYPEIQEIQF